MIHIHRYEVISVRVGRYIFTGGNATIVLKRCAVCSKVKTENVEGQWTFEEITGETK